MIEPSATCPCEHGVRGAARDYRACDACVRMADWRAWEVRERMKIAVIAHDVSDVVAHRPDRLRLNDNRGRPPFGEVRFDAAGLPTAIIVAFP